MDRRKTADVLFFALQCAKADRFAYADAVSNDPISQRDAMADVKAFERLQRMIFGTSDSALDAEARKMKPISVIRLKELLESSPELFKHSKDCDCGYCRKVT